MTTLVWGILIGLPLVWLVAMSGYTYIDAQRHAMNPRKWALVSLLIPLFGFFTYIFERNDRTSEEPEMFADGPFEIHKSRADEPLVNPASKESSAENADKNTETGDEETQEWKY